MTANGDKAPVVSVVIPAYKRTDLVRKAVESLFHQDLGTDAYEVIVVDSSPDDANSALLAELQASAPCNLRFYRKQPEGPGASRNLGVQHARGEFIAFMDSDCQATPGWLRCGLAAFHEGVALVQGRTGPDPAVPTGIFTWYVSVEKEGFIYECCNIFYRRSVLIEVGGFSNRDLTPTAVVPMGGEDVELAWRVRRSGWETAFAPEAVVYHEVVPISLWRWICIKRLYNWPAIVKRVPELRQFFFCRYFYDQSQAWLLLGVFGMVMSLIHPGFLILLLPYVVVRGSEPTRTLRGALRLARVCVYLPRDVTSLCLLTAGSLNHRCLLL